MARKVPDDVQKVFDKYTVNFVRRLNKDTALEMLAKEFKLEGARAELMFEMFDKDRNNILSAWEFYLFYASFGYEANAYLDKYEALQGGSGSADVAGAWDFLKGLKTLSGRPFEDDELETTMKSIMGEEKVLDQKRFIELISRIKLTRN
ncbi:uncharacterized protein LOC127863367 [Dreissena polymorpha]|uniref:EF-hand domain-containing protein n=1 Tax=Dreissena polymorpha TaxID=45954 RepID=A0A9D3Y5Y8_DREPO|nr:uncharacterized protein LOC127863367 [Dreissena polymorpha]KAH3692486.1 hypothetical protein DPMN_194327 [Dreissena polymorpha]